MHWKSPRGFPSCILWFLTNCKFSIQHSALNVKPLVSIIIPVYNVEKYLDKCIASVVNQTYTNLEIILVDDGSPDNCPAICDAWKERDPRINVIHQSNGGLSHARNEGLKLAIGEFIGFVDSDDWIEPDMYEILLTVMQETEADITICKYQKESNNLKESISIPNSPERQICTSEEALELLISSNNKISTAVWDKLFRRQVIGEIHFAEGKIFEDSLWTAQVIGAAQTIITIDIPLYHYFFRSDSLAHNVNNLKCRFRDMTEMLERRIQYLHEKYPSLENLAIAKYQVYCCYNYIQISLNLSQYDTDGSIRQFLYNSFCKWGGNKNFTIGRYKLGVVCLVFRFCPLLLPYIYSLYRNMSHCKKMKLILITNR